MCRNRDKVVVLDNVCREKFRPARFLFAWVLVFSFPLARVLYRTSRTSTVFILQPSTAPLVLVTLPKPGMDENRLSFFFCASVGGSTSNAGDEASSMLLRRRDFFSRRCCWRSSTSYSADGELGDDDDAALREDDPVVLGLLKTYSPST